MNREIKFRAKGHTHNQWLYGNLATDRTGLYVILPTKDWSKGDTVFEETIGQFTGVYDRNGKQVYEGDIVDTCPFERNRYSIFTVSFANGYKENLGMPQGWYLQQRDFEKYTPLITSNDETEKIEVIGNIYDNIDLLEE